jgi:hypothetical protein
MKYAYTYVLTCCVWLPYYTAPQPTQLTPEPESVGVACECCLPAQEPDWECADWQAKWGKHPEWIKEEWNY